MRTLQYDIYKCPKCKHFSSQQDPVTHKSMNWICEIKGALKYDNSGFVNNKCEEMVNRKGKRGK